MPNARLSRTQCLAPSPLRHGLLPYFSSCESLACVIKACAWTTFGRRAAQLSARQLGQNSQSHPSPSLQSPRAKRCTAHVRLPARTDRPPSRIFRAFADSNVRCSGRSCVIAIHGCRYLYQRSLRRHSHTDIQRKTSQSVHYAIIPPAKRRFNSVHGSAGANQPA